MHGEMEESECANRITAIPPHLASRKDKETLLDNCERMYLNIVEETRYHL